MTLPTVVLVGAMGAGKDTAAQWLVEDYGYQRIALADPLRRFVVDVFGPEAVRDKERYRSVYQLAGDAVRAVQADAFIRAVHRTMQSCIGPWVVTDARYPNEVEAFPQAVVVGIHAEAAVRRERIFQRDGHWPDPERMTHRSEQYVPALFTWCAALIENNGTLVQFEQAFWRAMIPLLEERKTHV